MTYGVIKLGPPVEDGVPTLRSSDVRHLCIENITTKSISKEVADQYSRTYLDGGEVLVTVRGTLGGVAAVPDELRGYNVSREVAVIPTENEICPNYLAIAIASLPCQNWLRSVQKGATFTGINIADLKRLPIPLPSQSEQRQIVAKVQALYAMADEIEVSVAEATRRTELAPQAVLSKAFRGELVPTEAELAHAEGRSYETAAELLARIADQATEESSRSKVKKRKRR